MLSAAKTMTSHPQCVPKGMLDIATHTATLYALQHRQDGAEAVVTYLRMQSPDIEFLHTK